MKANGREREAIEFLADYLKECMQAQKLNQSELSQLTHVPQDKISRILNKKLRWSSPDLVIMLPLLDPNLKRFIRLMQDRKLNNIYYQTFEIGQKYFVAKVSCQRDPALYEICPPFEAVPPFQTNTAIDHRSIIKCLNVLHKPIRDGQGHSFRRDDNKDQPAFRMERGIRADVGQCRCNEQLPLAQG